LTRSTLARRVVLHLVAAQLLAYFFVWTALLAAGLLGVEPWVGSFDELAEYRSVKLVAASLARGADDLPRIEPDAELKAEMRRVPGLRFAVFDRDGRALPGSAPELVATLAPLVDVTPVHTHFALRTEPKSAPLGYMERVWTVFGRLHVAVYGQKFRPHDIVYRFVDDLDWLGNYLAGMVVVSTAAAAYAVRRGLAPLRAVARDASRIDMASLDQRLDRRGVPAELDPLVEAVNAALSRLDVGVASQRRFTANAAHELRTPVAILSARLDAPEKPGFKDDLKRDARRIRNIVEQLLAFARLEARPVDLSETVDLVAVAKSIVSDAVLLAIKGGRQIDLEAPALPVTVRGNRAALESVLANLIDNALRAEPIGGSVLVRVAADATIAVVDHGEGVAETEREMIFEPFWRKLDSKPGLGLGLAIAKDLIDRHGGRIRVEATPGGGATFVLDLAPEGVA
jgi:two-component system OmpR family sensor kinase